MQPTNTDENRSLNVPKPIASYLAAERAKDTHALIRCFSHDARVHDESHAYHGIEAIKAWREETDSKYQYVMEPLDASVSENVVKLHARLTGSFPGSTVELDYTFTVANDKITSLEIK
jgi:hypothetical protein